jgi:8-oxo-dGTP diphosphatase
LSRHVLNECIEESEDLVLSSECGGYICNETYFRSLNSVLESDIRVGGRPLPVLFIHLPPTGLLPLDRQIKVVSDIAEAISTPPSMLVVGALLRDSSGRILSCRRPPGDQWSGWWEFPGGKVAEGETLMDAVSREVNEELGIQITPGEEVAREFYRYEDRAVDLRIIDCGVIDSDSITLIEHDESAWLDREDLNEVKWLPADAPIIEAWMANGLPRS